MDISKRLEMVASFVNEDAFLMDVGCDHALLDIYLYNNRKKINIIASDVNELPLEMALNNLKKYNLEKKIKLIRQNGIENIDRNIDTIVLSGMGTSTILDILFKNPLKLKNVSNIIISSNNDYFILRKTMVNNGFYIKDERIVFENGKYYPIILFNKGFKDYNDFMLKYGPILLSNKDVVFIDYIKYLITKKRNILMNLTDKHLDLKNSIKKEISELENIVY